MSRRRRNKTRAAAAGDGTGGVTAARVADHYARVLVDDDTWETFKHLVPAGNSINRVLGDLVTRHVHTVQARQAQAGELDDLQLLDVLDRARELQSDLDRMLARIEDRIDHPHPHADSTLSRSLTAPLPFRTR